MGVSVAVSLKPEPQLSLCIAKTEVQGVELTISAGQECPRFLFGEASSPRDSTTKLWRSGQNWRRLAGL